MNLANAKRLIGTLPSNALVLDVGGGASPFPRADWVVDAVPYEGRGTGSDGNAHTALGVTQRYAPETWVQVDLCARNPWPFSDKAFDFAVCSHLLEDVRDPIWVCSELRRVSKAGYIETPSRFVEQSTGVEHPRHAGFYHHRWLVEVESGGLVFRLKPHSIHSFNDAVVARLGSAQAINPKYATCVLEWQDSFDSAERLEFNEDAVTEELCGFAERARAIPDLVVPVPMPMGRYVKRRIYYWRLSRGLR